jgi:hypothetical protein
MHMAQTVHLCAGAAVVRTAAAQPKAEAVLQHLNVGFFFPMLRVNIRLVPTIISSVLAQRAISCVQQL